MFLASRHRENWSILEQKRLPIPRVLVNWFAFTETAMIVKLHNSDINTYPAPPRAFIPPFTIARDPNFRFTIVEDDLIKVQGTGVLNFARGYGAFSNPLGENFPSKEILYAQLEYDNGEIVQIRRQGDTLEIRSSNHFHPVVRNSFQVKHTHLYYDQIFFGVSFAMFVVDQKRDPVQVMTRLEESFTVV